MEYGQRPPNTTKKRVLGTSGKARKKERATSSRK